MVNTDELKGKIAAKRMNQTKLAKVIGISGGTLTARLKKGVFQSDEIEKIVEALALSDADAIRIFFSR